MAKLFVSTDKVIKQEEDTACDQQHQNADGKGQSIGLGTRVQNETSQENQGRNKTGISQNNNHDPATNLLQSCLETGGFAVLTAFTGIYGASGFILTYFLFFGLYQYRLAGRLEQPRKIMRLCRWATLVQSTLVVIIIALPMIESMSTLLSLAVGGAVMRAMSDSLALQAARTRFGGAGMVCAPSDALVLMEADSAKTN